MNKLIYLFLAMTLVFCSHSEKSKLEKGDQQLSAEYEMPKTILVEIFAEQFQWTIRYAGENNELGTFDYKLMNGSNPLGLMTTESIQRRLTELENELIEMDSMSLNMEVTEEFMKKHQRMDAMLRLLRQMNAKHNSVIDKFALDDIIISDTLVLCVNQEYEFRFRSKDVIHAAYFPDFRAQMNTVPGQTTRFKFTPTKTTQQAKFRKKDDQFEYMLQCNKVCGEGHDSMKMVVRVVDEIEYASWMKANENQVFEYLFNLVERD